jgi:DNA-binding transcriptional regulator YiaG
MPDFGTALGDEVTRLAKKANKSELQSLRKTTSEQRHQIAALRRQLATVQQTLRKISGGKKSAAVESAETEAGSQLRFSAKGLAKKRQQLGLSAAAMEKLLGVSVLSVYKWESGNTRPRQKQLQSIAAVRSMGKREAQAKLEELG